MGHPLNLVRIAVAAGLFVGAALQADAQVSVAGSLSWRNIGPNRGGRSIAAAGSERRPLEYYFGATGGGLWKTTDGGNTWAPVTDGQLRSSSVGAVAVAPSNPDIVYLGMGETQLRGNVMQGDGIYKSIDAGQTWTHIGLAESQAIARIVVDPSNPDIVYVAALGHPYGSSEQRGVFRSTDGGRNWKRVLFRDNRTGAVDLAIDPRSPRVLYATLWEVYRKPWVLWSGGAGSGVFKSADGGDTWSELTRNPGMPAGVIGKVTVAVSGADSKRVYANVEAEKGGLYKSDDAGATWSLANGHRDLWQRSFYFMRIAADPKDRETVYILNVELLKSTDGGRTYKEIRAPHADHHDLWIDPSNPERMVNANDGGGNVTVNGGRTWTRQNYPTAQLYRVATTFDVPYHACAGQQDNTSVCVPSETGHLQAPDEPIGNWFYEVGGGENAVIAPDPRNPDIFYANETNSLSRYDRSSGLHRDVQPYPRLVMGEPASGMRERWNWTYPIVVSPFDKATLYAGSQNLWTTADQGRTWRKISPDLTRADPSTMRDSGGPIFLDQDGPEIYATIFTIAPSALDGGVIWVGSDDGLVHLTRDGGTTWAKVTPPDAGPFTKMSRIDASAAGAGTAYVAGNRYQQDDRAPYIWKTHDFGKTWTKIVSGIRADDFVHVVRADPVRSGLLYAGTEHGVYVSYDDGANWRTLSLNLPDLQVSDLVVKDNDLVIATHGRSFYVLDDVSALRQMTAAIGAQRSHLFIPAAAVRRSGAALIDFHLKSEVVNLRLEILDSAGAVIAAPGAMSAGPARRAGMHRIRWDLRYGGATVFRGIVLEGGNPAQGPWAPPGSYRVRLIADGDTLTQPLRVGLDPRQKSTAADMRAQFELAMRIRDRTSEANAAVVRIRELRGRVQERMAEPANEALRPPGNRLLAELNAVESELYQVRNQSSKDKIAFPIKLNNRLSGLRWNLEKGDAAPTEAYYQVFRELSAELDVQLTRLERALANGPERLWK